MQEIDDFNEEFYLRNNFDVAQAVKNGEYESGLHHFTKYGRDEGRPGAPKNRRAEIDYGSFGKSEGAELISQTSRGMAFATTAKLTTAYESQTDHQVSDQHENDLEKFFAARK